MALPSKPCIVCGRPIPRTMTRTEVRPLTKTDGSSRAAKINADLFDLADCRRRTNHPYVTRAARNGAGMIVAFDSWDGETYDSEFFCTRRCAMKQGVASARSGARFTWKGTDDGNHGRTA